MAKKKSKNKKKKKGKDKEFDDDVLEIRRVTRVVSGGKRMSFRATVVVGNRKGKVGVAIGKGTDVADSIRKAKNRAKKQMIKVPLKDNRTVPYDVDVKKGAAEIRLKPVPEGHGLIAGGAARVVLDLAGVKDISAKLLGGTNNKLNNARVTVEALRRFEHLLDDKKDKKK
ncbi:MAG TPA: 30S ribosomal protein S5 [Candidatus Paceibacterota bacterium]|nr:30S ribosomal protein S5 [Candidatus Paceibacterota bacterium]